MHTAAASQGTVMCWGEETKRGSAMPGGYAAAISSDI